MCAISFVRSDGLAEPDDSEDHCGVEVSWLAAK
jgi:hypothetical protein